MELIDEAPTAAQISADVRAGRRTPQDVVEACLARIAAVDDRIGAFQFVDAARARRDAEQVARRRDLADLPLAGVPVAIKDNIDVAGMPARHGSGATSPLPRPSDDLLVTRLREAGAIIVGKTRLPELGIWDFTESKAHGGTRNPRNPRRNAGGSTGGGAAAVAAGMVPVAPTAAVVRCASAANCSIVGFRQPRPRTDPGRQTWFSCRTRPIATSVADVA
jgi:amidase